MNDHENDNGPRIRAVTIADVALRAGVSRQTVSRAINGRGEISATTRERVLAAVRELGYRPNSIARGLKTRRTLTIGLVVPDIANPFFAEVARGGFEVAHREGYGVLLCNTDEAPAQEMVVLQMLADHRVDGVVLCSSRLSESQLQSVIERRRPLVVVNRTPQRRLAGLGSVSVADSEDARRVVHYLHGLGHRAIALVGGVGASQSSRGRREGYALGMAQIGQPVAPEWVVESLPNVDAGRRGAAALLSAHPEITALLAFNDLVAVGCVQACQAAGLQVPEDVSVVGWDDILFAPYLSPPLTTVRLPKTEIGARAMTLLLALIRDPELVLDPIELDGELIARKSAGSAPAHHHSA